jgi:ABC-type nitrate/sulfonate/bicarbonate transport system ATPase subunit
MFIKIAGLTHSFFSDGCQFSVLESIDLAVDQGEFICILGPSGCGKTTLLNIIAGLMVPAAGRIYRNDKLVRDAQGHVAYMQQKDLLLPWRRALGNTLLATEIQGGEGREAEREARALFQRFGLSGHEKRYPAELSGGARQRVALIRTLLTQKPLLLLDEPFSALDALTQINLHQWLLQAWHDYKKTILMVTHNLEEALMLADRIYLLSARPARIKSVFTVELPRPRDPTSVPFAQVKKTLWQAVSTELAEALE